MNAASIATYIAKLEKENKDLRAKVESLTQDKIDLQLKIVDYEYDSDSESVASNDVDDDEFFVSYNTKLADVLDTLADYETDEHKKKAYDDAAYAVYKLPYKVTNGDELARGPKKVPGIGKSIAAKINEFLETGKIKKLEQLAAVDETHDDYFVDELNAPLVRHFDKLAREEEDYFKSVAYKKAARAIEALNFKVTNGDELAQGPKKVRGIGKSIARKIDNFLAPNKKVSFEPESNPVSTNEEIAWHLDKLASLEAEEHGSQDPHKIRAYRKAAESIRSLDFEVTNGTEISQGSKKVPGIGKSIARKIDELLVNGYIQRIRDLS